MVEDGESWEGIGLRKSDVTSYPLLADTRAVESGGLWGPAESFDPPRPRGWSVGPTELGRQPPTATANGRPARLSPRRTERA